VDVLKVHKPDTFTSAALPGDVGVDAALAGTFVSCVEQLIAQTASKHKPVRK
jgi:hypothetical protein